MMNKTLQTLIERAEQKGSAVKRVRECNIMGNRYGSQEMINQWEVKYSRTLKQDGSIEEFWKVFHYDTLIFHADNNCAGGWVLTYYYGESNTDRDALNGLCSHFGIPTRFRYGSKIGFITA